MWAKIVLLKSHRGAMLNILERKIRGYRYCVDVPKHLCISHYESIKSNRRQSEVTKPCLMMSTRCQFFQRMCVWMVGTCCIHYFHCGPIIVVGSVVAHDFLKRILPLDDCVEVSKRGSHNCMEGKCRTGKIHKIQSKKNEWASWERLRKNECRKEHRTEFCQRRINRLWCIQMYFIEVVLCALLRKLSFFE